MTEGPIAKASRTMRQIPKVRDVMHRNFAAVSPETPLREVAKIILKRGIPGAAVIDEKKRFRGFLSTQGLMRALVDFLNEETPGGPIETYLDPDLPRLNEDSAILVAVRAFAQGRVSLALPVLRGERLVGVVTRLDVIRATLDYFAGSKDTGPGTLYISALMNMDEGPAFDESEVKRRKR